MNYREITLNSGKGNIKAKLQSSSKIFIKCYTLKHIKLIMKIASREKFRLIIYIIKSYSLKIILFFEP